MSFDEFDDSSSWEFDPAVPITLRLDSASPSLDFETDIFLGLSYTPPLDDDEEDDKEDDDTPESSSRSSTSNGSLGTSLETPLDLPLKTPEGTDTSPWTVGEFVEQFPQFSPDSELWPATPSELASGPSPDTRVSILGESAKRPTKVLARRRMASDASDSQSSLIEFAGLIALPPLPTKIRCFLY